ncbi:glycosyl hydrolase [Prevotella sp. 10(H)]|uniref:glycosyl hydrolase n=1 Tax=Prevotella sp. 10(H) TaxID=1158294 RepID=UPI00068F6578|nr:glycosyl hydrolase [Prevotella sp. 10(H)]
MKKYNNILENMPRLFSQKLVRWGIVCLLLSAPVLLFALRTDKNIKDNPLRSNNIDKMYEGFVNLPDSTKLGTYWYWLNENVSKEGITKDLEALHSKGMGEVYIGNIYWGGGEGTVKTLSDEWLECMRHAIREGSRIGINVSLFNCPGWSQSGGPWVKPEDAMRYLVYSEVEVEGPKTISQYIGKPKDFFQDVSVIAYPVLLEDKSSKTATIKSMPETSALNNLTDSDLGTICKFTNKRDEPVQIDIKYRKPETKRSLYMKPGDQSFQMNCEVLMKKNGQFVTVKSHSFDRINREVRMGADPSAPLALSLGEVTSDEFRIIMKDVPEGFEIRELDLSAKPILENYPEKWLIKIPSKATPDWFAHIWPNQEQISTVGVVTEKQIQNISKHLKGDTLYWKVPKGKWKVLRIGMTTTNTTNQPAAPVARGLEIDKMNRRPIQNHYNSYVGRIVNGMSKSDLKSFNRIIADSYETGPENWTDGFDTVFVNRYGYDPYPWMAVLTGQIVGSADESNRFLWDMRRLIAERVASEFVGGMREISEKNGVSLWLENYGWDGFPSEFILYSKYSPAIGGEFWTNHGDNIECRLASSGAHMYGKNVVYAESYTTINHSFTYYPGNLKEFGDKSYAEGINQCIMHLCIHQPYEDRVPGVNSWFGIEYNRHNTWFDQSKAWIDYQRRCCYMLQQGRHHADVCYFISEESPKMSGWIDESLRKGYDYDFINSDVIQNVIKVKDGRLVLPSGVSYSLLVLPPLNTIRPEVLKSIKELISQGANILGSPLERSPSMVGYPQCDREVQNLSKEIWGSADYNIKEKIEKKFGKGNVFCNIHINTVLEKIGTSEAVSYDQSAPLLWKQRALNDGNIFFLTNQKDSLMTVDVTFNTTGYRPELWNPVDGTRRKIDNYTFKDGKTIIPVTFDGFESCFIVFSEKTTVPGDGKVPQERTIATLDNTWDIVFFNKWIKEKIELKQHGLENWAKSDDSRMRHFSGIITYTNDFEISGSLPKENVFLSFENLYETASVSINGKKLDREVWCKPYRIDVTPYLRQGKNQVEVNVSTSWRNKIIEQNKKPAEEREISYMFYSGSDELSPSGIWGAVNLKIIE